MIEFVTDCFCSEKFASVPGQGGAAVRFSESSGGLLESCLVQNNDIGVAVNDEVRCAVYSSLFQFNHNGAFYACEHISNQVLLVLDGRFLEF